MALPTIYFDTGGHAQGSGSSDAASPIVSNTSGAAVAGSIVTVAGADLSGVVADGSMTVYIADATNTNQKIFKITAVDNTVGVKTITVTPAPTGVVSSAWRIGGQAIFLSADIDCAKVFQYIINAGNVIMDDINTDHWDTSFNPKLTSATYISEEGGYWSAEFKLPIKEMVPSIKTGAVWRCNIARTKTTGDNLILNSWPVFGNNWYRQYFGYLIFE